MAELSWADLGFGGLSTDQVYDILALRSAVFVVEQNCPYLDIDGRDRAEGTRHLLGTTPDGRLAAYARILGPSEGAGPVQIGRVVIHPEARASQLGRALMVRALESCQEHWPLATVRVSAQAHLKDFYSSLGFVAEGEVYDEDGIPHLDMIRP